MQTLMNKRIPHVFPLLSLFLLLATPAAFTQPGQGQGFEGGIRIKLRAEPVVVPVKQQRAVELRAKPGGKGGPAFTKTTGALSVVSEPLATIFLRPVGAAKDIDKEECATAAAQIPDAS